MSDMKTFIETYSKLLPLGKSISMNEAEKRAGEFLNAMATIANWKHEFTAQKIKYTSVQTAVYAQEMSKGTAKTVTENKLTAEASEVYITAREELEQIENDISYLRAYFDIFKDAHLLYRQLSKGENT